MKRITPLLVFILIAVTTQWLVIKYIPNLVHLIALHRINGVTNKWINNNRTDARMRKVVLPNPDFKYSALFYDISEHDIDITGVLPDSSYGSVAFYDNRCQPFYVYNNLVPGRKGHFEFVLSKNTSSESRHIQPPSSKGVIICRYLVKGDSSFAAMGLLQKQLACTVK